PELLFLFIAAKAAPTENSVHWRVVLLHDRKFRFTGGSCSCRAVISAGRQVGRSAGRDVGISAVRHIGSSAYRQIGRLVIGELAIGELTVVSAYIPRPPSRVPRPEKIRLTWKFAIQKKSHICRD
ncbi:MAG: hypothetical protein ACK4I8_11020, partial [Armatimonadota bacterium]